MYNIYGIKTCNTMKKAFDWLQQHQISYVFHNYKTEGISNEQIELWATKINLRDLINRRGLTYRRLDMTVKTALETLEGTIACLVQYPTLIKRPVLTKGTSLLVGFTPEDYARFTNVKNTHL